MMRLQVPEEGSYSLRYGLEDDERLVGRLELTFPPISRMGGEDVRARRELLVEDRLDGFEGGGLGRIGREDEAHRADRAGRLERVGAHAGGSPTTGRPAEKSSVARPRVARSTTAARAGTGEMLRIRWYSVSDCQVEALSSSTPRYRSTP